MIGNTASMSEDDDVRDEYQRLKSSTSNDSDVLTVRHLRKEFVKRPDVNDKKNGCCGTQTEKVVRIASEIT